MQSRGCKYSQENTKGIQVCVRVRGEAINSMEICTILKLAFLFC